MGDVTMDDLDYAGRGKIMGTLITPRPLAWISTLSADGMPNIAPFNSYCGLANTPPLLGIAFSERDNAPKTTLANIEATGVFVLNIVTKALAETMNESARESDKPTDDFIRLGLERAAITGFSVPRIAASPAALACRVESVQNLPPSRVRFVVAQVVAAYTMDGYDPLTSDVLASVAPLMYASLHDGFTLPKVWG